MNARIDSRDAALSSARERRISQEELLHFRSRGWLLISQFFDAAYAVQLGRWADELVAMPERPAGQMLYCEPSLLDPQQRVVQRIEYFCEVHPQLGSLLNDGPLPAAAGRLLDDAAVLFKEKINFKYPGGAGFEAHQDQQAGWSRYAPLFVSALVAIDEATPENGCLEIETGRQERRTELIGAEWTPLNAAGHATLAYRALPTLPGDVVFFDSFVPHRSGSNLTRSTRRLLYATYNGRRHGDHRQRYFQHKRDDFPPDSERLPGRVYQFRV